MSGTPPFQDHGSTPFRPCLAAGVKLYVGSEEPVVELGVGAGYFLGALQSSGVSAYRGIEANPDLAKRVQNKFGQEKIICGQDIASAVSHSTAQIYTAFFVLEHLEEQKTLTNALKAKPEGTVFVFSVPTFGLTPVLNTIFTKRWVASCFPSV